MLEKSMQISEEYEDVNISDFLGLLKCEVYCYDNLYCTTTRN